jgi:uncharacterized membrane protein
MLDGGYLKRLEADLERWRASGDLSADQADKLFADARARAAKPATSFSNIAAILGAILFGLGVIAFIGANWDALPKLARLGAALALVWLTFLGAAYAFRRTAHGLAHALALLGALCLGAAIAMVGQTYNIAGDETGLVLWWSIGALLTAAVFSSRPVLIFYVILAFVYFAMARPGDFLFDHGPSTSPSLTVFGVTYLPLWLAGAFLGRRWDSGAAMHLSGLAALIWATLLFTDSIWLGQSRHFTTAGCLLIAFGAATGAISHYLQTRQATRAGAIALSWSAAIFFVGAVIAQVALEDKKEFVTQMLFSAVMLAASAWAMKWGDAAGRKAVRGFGVALFVFETFYIYVTLFKDLLDTSLFLLGGGAVLLALAYGLRKFTAKPKAETISGSGA